MPITKKQFLLLLVMLILGVSFWYSASWLRLCSGVALFLFGMQCLEEGLKQMAGDRMELWLERSTATHYKAFLFGAGGTMLLQSTTLMSMLTVAFISTGMIQLAGGISILLGINLGATGGVWLLAAAGQNISLSPLALPMLVFAILLGLQGDKGKAAGRVIFGIAFIFMAIEQMKGGFADIGNSLDLTRQVAEGISGQLLFMLGGIVLTIMLMSSHATLMLVLAALAAGQLELWQGMSIAIGGNIGSSLNVGMMGWLGGNRSGQRLALAHTLFNLGTGVLAFVLLKPLLWLIQLVTPGQNSLLELACFHTLFNLLGVLVFWPLQNRLAQLLYRWLPDPVEPAVLIPEALSVTGASAQTPVTLTSARYLSESALASAETAAHAVVQELQHLGRLSLEVICHAIYLPVSQLTVVRVDENHLNAKPEDLSCQDADTLYQRHIKGVYSEILGFMSRLNVEMDSQHHNFWLSCQLAALQLVDAVKDVKHLQKNLSRYLRDDRSYVHNYYLDLRRHLLWVMRQIKELSRLDIADDIWLSRLEWLDGQAAKFDQEFRQRIFIEVRKQQLTSMQASSLINDLGYCSRITQSLRNVQRLGLLGDDTRLRNLRNLVGEDEGPLIQI